MAKLVSGTGTFEPIANGPANLTGEAGHSQS